MASPMARAEAVLARKCLVIGLVRVKVGWKCRFPFVGGQSRTSRREELEKRIALEKFDKFCGIDQVRGDPDAADRAFGLCRSLAGLLRRNQVDDLYRRSRRRPPAIPEQLSHRIAGVHENLSQQSRRFA